MKETYTNTPETFKPVTLHLTFETQAGLDENCIWNKLFQIRKDNIIDFGEK